MLRCLRLLPNRPGRIKMEIRNPADQLLNNAENGDSQKPGRAAKGSRFLLTAPRLLPTEYLPESRVLCQA